MTKVRHAGIAIGVQPGTRVFRIERNAPRGHMALTDGSPLGEYCEDVVGSWCVWINPAPDFETGTYLKLHDNGRMERVTLYADGHEDVWLIKPED